MKESLEEILESRLPEFHPVVWKSKMEIAEAMQRDYDLPEIEMPFFEYDGLHLSIYLHELIPARNSSKIIDIFELIEEFIASLPKSYVQEQFFKVGGETKAVLDFIDDFTVSNVFGDLAESLPDRDQNNMEQIFGKFVSQFLFSAVNGINEIMADEKLRDFIGPAVSKIIEANMCPVCREKLMFHFHYCSVCGWTRYLIQEAEPTEVFSYNPVSLLEARKNYMIYGAITKEKRDELDEENRWFQQFSDEAE